MEPVEPPPCVWELPDVRQAPDGLDLVGLGADLEPGTLLAAYRSALFPMHVDLDGHQELGWWSPDPRARIPLDGFHRSRSLRRSMRRFRYSVDTSLEEVIAACAVEHDGERWILPSIASAFARLHDLGWVHSVEVRDPDGRLVGGLYGIAIGGLFAGESMFHRVTDASKAAVACTVDLLAADGLPRLFDVQWRTDHLASLGAVEEPRTAYAARLQEALRLPPVRWALPEGYPAWSPSTTS